MSTTRCPHCGYSITVGQPVCLQCDKTLSWATSEGGAAVVVIDSATATWRSGAAGGSGRSPPGEACRLRAGGHIAR